MGTKFASYTLKLASLHEFYQRLLHGNQPIPPGSDIANTLKYFSQSLLSLLKDVEKSPYEMITLQSLDAERMALYPNLDYKQLFNALSQLIDVAPSIHVGLQVFGQALLQCLACLLPFLEHDLIENLPYLTASTIAVLPDELHQEIINYLCFYILPFTLARKMEDESENYTSQSISAVIMMIFEYSKNPAHHCQLLECLMALKSGVIKDLLCVIAYGTSSAKASATKLLFYYWPAFNPNLFDRRSVLMKFSNDFTPFVCQRDDCPNSGSVEAAKVCYNHSISITFATDSPPPIYLCIECANEIHRENPNQNFCDVLHPMQQVSLICENKNCRSNDKSAISVCFSTECASYNGNHPIRYCVQCHNIRHNNRRGGDHIYHTALCHISQMDPQMQTYMVQAIISLLKEAEPLNLNTGKDLPESYSMSKPSTMYSIGCSTGSRIGNNEPPNLEERQLLGRYGVWLLVGLCTPDKDIPPEILGRLLSMLFHWFHVTAYSFDGTKKSLIHLIFSVGQAESTLEKLKTEHVCPWLFEIVKKHYDIFVSCLLPHPQDYVRVGGHWETLASRTSHLKDGLNRLFCLVPYEVITSAIWDYVMPHWMEAIVNDVPTQDLPELKMTLCKILDPDMSPLGFDAKKMYNFVAKRFYKTNAKIQEQALNWLQTLTRLEITIPLSQLFAMFGDGIAVYENVTPNDNQEESNATSSDDKDPTICRIEETTSGRSTPLSDDDVPAPRRFKFTTDEELNLSCCILMLDILLKQMELQNIDKHTGINSWVCRDACNLLKSTNVAYWSSQHKCSNVSECAFCESTVVWHQLCLHLLTYIAPEKLAYPPDTVTDEWADESGKKSPAEGTKKGDKADVINMPVPETHSVGGVLVHMPHFFEQIMTATVETVSEQLDLATMMPTERIMSAVARAVTLSETDVATATVNVDKPNIVGENDQPLESDTDLEDFWQTSMGKFRFSINDLPEQLQFVHKLFKELVIEKNPDILCYMIECLNMMCLYGDILNSAVKDHQGFFIWCQENLLIKNLWELLNAEHSHVAHVAVPLLLHCVTLPCGIDTFWNIIQEEFHNSDWRTRFKAVERVTLIARFMDSTPLKSAITLQTALASLFSYLINSMDDIDVYVAQKATLYLGTIHDTAMKALLMCMETQFDLVIVDRPIILQSLYQLHNSLSDRRILTWDFFLNRFDTLFLEAQINLEKMGDINYFRDLKNTDLGSEVFMKKLQRAHEALSQSDGSGSSNKTLSASFGTKWPYKRTMSAPASTTPRQDTKIDSKLYSRQYSAPLLKRKSSRFGLGQLIGYTLPNNSLADVHVPSFSMLEDGNFPGFMNKIVELEEADKETMHLLIFLLMQFLSRPDQAYPTEEKSIAKPQSIVLRHLFTLLGYNQTDKNYWIPPQKLRSTAVFNAFMMNLPQVLDQNHNMGLSMIQSILTILQIAPCPPLKQALADNFTPTYSLWYLETYVRRSWLMSLLVILYKYEYGQQYWRTLLQTLIRIVLHTLDHHFHKCKHMPATVVMSSSIPSRSRDVSQPSLGVDHDIPPTNYDDEHNTPPVRKTGTNQRTVGINLNQNVDTHWEEPKLFQQRLNKFSSYSLNAEDTESELAAIPESPKSDNTIQDSSNTSMQGEISDDAAIFSDDASIMHLRSHRRDSFPKQFKKGKSSFTRSDLKFIRVSESCSRESRGAIAKHSDNAGENSERSSNSQPGPSASIESRQGKTKPTTSLSQPTSSQKAASETSSVSGMEHSESDEMNRPIDQTLAPTSSMLFQDALSTNSSEQNNSSAASSHSSCTTKVDNGQPFLHRYNTQLHISLPTIERLLPVGSTTRGANVQSHGPDSETCASSHVSSQSISELELPQPERLLPIGPQRETPTTIINITATTSSAREENARKPEDITLPLSAPATSPTPDDTSSKAPSQRKLIKQIALESPPFPLDSEQGPHLLDDERKSKKKDQGKSSKDRDRKSQREDSQSKGFQGYKSADEITIDFFTQQAYHADFTLKQSAHRIGEDCNAARCSDCGALKEEYTDEELGLCIIILGTFIHREPVLAAPMLPEILHTVTNVSLLVMYPWQSESSIYLPGSAGSVAHQFLRCVLHQMAPNGIFMQIFSSNMKGSTCTRFFKSVAQALVDFNELNPIAPLQILIESMNSKKSLPTENLTTILKNIACYLDCLPLEAGLGPGATTWSGLILQFDGLFRRLVLLLSTIDDITHLLKIMISILKVPGIQQSKGMLDPFSKVLSYTIQNCFVNYHYLVDLCCLCQRNFTKDRDKHYLSRTLMFELIQAMKFKIILPDTNFLLLLHLALQDVGGQLLATIKLNEPQTHVPPIYNTNASEPLRSQITDIIDFLMDVHTSMKIKSYTVGMQKGLNEDTLSGILKCGFAQFLALEITKGNARENRAAMRYLPWLYTAPSTMPQGSKEYLDCIGHIRLLSWILLGSLTHSLTTSKSNLTHSHGLPLPVSHPIPQEASCHIADHVQVALTAFPEHYKSSVINMSSLFHVFNLCQLWTLYLEEHSKGININSEAHNITTSILFEFWGKVTPSIIQLISQSKVFADIVHLHFMSLLETFLDCNCTILIKLLPMWNLIINSNQNPTPSHLHTRLLNFGVPGLSAGEDYSLNESPNVFLLQWIRRLQFKMGQIELQASTTTQFYSL